MERIKQNFWEILAKALWVQFHLRNISNLISSLLRFFRDLISEGARLGWFFCWVEYIVHLFFPNLMIIFFMEASVEKTIYMATDPSAPLTSAALEIIFNPAAILLIFSGGQWNGVQWQWNGVQATMKWSTVAMKWSTGNNGTARVLEAWKQRAEQRWQVLRLEAVTQQPA